MSVQFSWDPVKAASNFQKHRVTFELATEVFDDPNHLCFQDRFENGEYRWQAVGMVENHLILLVAHTVKFIDGSEYIRIISARRATPVEKKRYERHYLHT